MQAMNLETLKQLVEVAMDQEVKTLGADTDLYGELGMDSMGAVALVVEIQRRFHVRIQDEDMPQLRTPALMLDYINRRAADVGLAASPT